jgi:hypothetical protein
MSALPPKADVRGAKWILKSAVEGECDPERLLDVVLMAVAAQRISNRKLAF